MQGLETKGVAGIGERIRQGRLAKGLTQGEFARLIGVKRTSVVGWERGDGNPRLEYAPKLAEVLGLTLEQLIQGD